jgi:hypothetical protein
MHLDTSYQLNTIEDTTESDKNLLHIYIFYWILTPMADWQLHYMPNVMILTLQLSCFYIVTYNFHLLMVCTSPSAGMLSHSPENFGSKLRMFNLFIAIHNEGPDYIIEVIPHINKLISFRNSSYLPWIDERVFARHLKTAQEKSLITFQTSNTMPNVWNVFQIENWWQIK